MILTIVHAPTSVWPPEVYPDSRDKPKQSCRPEANQGTLLIPTMQTAQIAVQAS